MAVPGGVGQRPPVPYIYEVPQSLQQSWAARSYHGDARNNVRGVVNRFIGHCDGEARADLLTVPIVNGRSVMVRISLYHMFLAASGHAGGQR